MYTIIKSLFFFLASITLLALSSCGENDDKPAKPAVQNVKVMVTAFNAGSRNPTTTVTTIGGLASFTPESGFATSSTIAGTEVVTYAEPAANIGASLTVRLSFDKARGPINSTSSLTAEIFADGVSVKRLVLDAASTASNPSTKAPSVEYTYTL